MRLEEVDLSGLAQNIAAELETNDPDRKVDFVIEKDVKGIGDKTLLRAVMENLLGNAWKFTQKQTEAKIEFGKTEKEGKTIYFIRDNGVGFDMKYANKLFIPFQRLHSDSEFAGTGVGLTLVQRIVRRHGGDIWVESAVEKGATSLLMPVACRRQLVDLSDDMATKIDIQFYSDARDALLKAMAE